MIEIFLNKIVEELGATGLLVIGLYFMMYRPLNSIALHIHNINDEIGEILALLNKNQDAIKK